MCEKKSYDASVLLWVPDDLFFPKKGPLGRQGKKDRQTDRQKVRVTERDGWMDG